MSFCIGIGTRLAIVDEDVHLVEPLLDLFPHGPVPEGGTHGPEESRVRLSELGLGYGKRCGAPVGLVPQDDGDILPLELLGRLVDVEANVTAGRGDSQIIKGSGYG